MKNNYNTCISLIYFFCGVGLLFSFYCLYLVLYMIPNSKTSGSDIEENKDNEEEILVKNLQMNIDQKQTEKIDKIIITIKNCVKEILFKENTFLFMFIAIMTILIFITNEGISRYYTSSAFFIGSVTSIICGYVGVIVSSKFSLRKNNELYFLDKVFNSVLLTGCVYGFFIVSLTIGLLTFIMEIFKFKLKITSTIEETYNILLDSFLCYSLGILSVGLFSRLGSSLFIKFNSYNSNLLNNSLEDSDNLNNQTLSILEIISKYFSTSNKGLNLCGSLVVSFCGFILIGKTSNELNFDLILIYPILLCSMGIFSNVLAAVLYLWISSKITSVFHIERLIKWSTIFLTIFFVPCIYFSVKMVFPHNFSIGEKLFGYKKVELTHEKVIICISLGSMLNLIMMFLLYNTSNLNNNQLDNQTEGCQNEGGINIILGFGIGLKSCFVHTSVLCFTLFISYYISGIFGISLTALGIFCNLSLIIALNCVESITESSYSLMKFWDWKYENKKVLDDLKLGSSGVSIIEKSLQILGIFIVSFIGLAAFFTKANINNVILNSPYMLSAIFFGFMLPYLISSLSIKSVISISKMISNENNDLTVKFENQYNFKIIEKYYNQNVLNNFPSLLISILLPLGFGILIGPKEVFGLLLGVILSGLQLCISSSISSEIWNNCKSNIESNNFFLERGIKITTKERLKLKINELNIKKDIENENINSIEAEIKLLKDELNEQIEEKEEYIGNEFTIFKDYQNSSDNGKKIGDQLNEINSIDIGFYIKFSIILSITFSSLFNRTSLIINKFTF